MGSLVVPSWAHGRPGRGQGGWCCGELARIIAEHDQSHAPLDDGTITVALKRPLPLETPLPVRRTGSAEAPIWEVVEPADTSQVILRAAPATVEPAPTPVVDVATAADARRRFDPAGVDHVAATCFSCGVHDDSMRVWPVALDDGTGRVATDWTPREEFANRHGRIDERVIWTALDCTSGFYTGEPDPNGVEQHGVTVQYAVTVAGPVAPGQTYVLVGHAGHYDPAWDGRKRGAGASLFDTDGTLLAYADSFWVAVAD